MYTSELAREGDIIGIIYNSTGLYFSINGVPLGRAYEKIPISDTYIHLEGEGTKIELINYNTVEPTVHDIEFTADNSKRHDMVFNKLKKRVQMDSSEDLVVQLGSVTIPEESRTTIFNLECEVAEEDFGKSFGIGLC
jgi:hypothetical protein